MEGITPLGTYHKRVRTLPRSARVILAARKARARANAGDGEKDKTKALPFSDRAAIRRRDEAIQAVRALDSWAPTGVVGSASAAAAAAAAMILAPDASEDTGETTSRSGSSASSGRLSASIGMSRSDSRASDTSSEASFSEEIIARQAQERLSRRIKRAQARRKRRKRLVVVDADEDEDGGGGGVAPSHAGVASRRAASEASRRLSIASTPVFQRLIRYG